MNDSLGDELHRLNLEFRKLVDDLNSTEKSRKTIFEQLTNHFGLTPSEAKAWLTNEPNFQPNRRKETAFQNRRRSTRTRHRDTVKLFDPTN